MCSCGQRDARKRVPVVAARLACVITPRKSDATGGIMLVLTYRSSAVGSFSEQPFHMQLSSSEGRDAAGTDEEAAATGDEAFPLT